MYAHKEAEGASVLPSAGLFITLYDEQTLRLYLDRGVYGQLMAPVFDKVSVRSRHHHILADYACVRRGAHVFFFLHRKIIYGGQVLGSETVGSFCLNGPYSPMGRKAQAQIYWDESTRETYRATARPGLFTVPTVGERCQPYLLRFSDALNLQGTTITSDQLYFELGNFNYPLPSNSISGMGFCTLTPGETDIALSLLRQEPMELFEDTTRETTQLLGAPLPFTPAYGISHLHEAISEAHLEASALANPELLPPPLRPERTTLCRQVPISPFKPYQMDRADICYFSEDSIAEGTIPNTIIELKNKRTGKSGVKQIERYLAWLHKILPRDASRVSLYLFAPSFTKNAATSIPSKYRDQVELLEFNATQAKLKR